MKLSSAWIVVEDGQRPAGLVAARTLRKRLDTVWRELTVAGSGSTRDVACVHRLRVATRRALAAIDAFRDLLPTKRADWYTKQLRRIRRAAGEARDLDVLTERLTAEPRIPEAARPAAGSCRCSRSSAKSRASRSASPTSGSSTPGSTGLSSCWKASRPAVHSRRFAPTRNRFQPMMRRFFTAADRKLRSADEMHALRIEGKKLRYAMEIFSSMFSPRMRARCYDALEKLQETLGDFTDHAAAADRLRRLAHEPSAAANRHVLEQLSHGKSSGLTRLARRSRSGGMPIGVEPSAAASSRHCNAHLPDHPCHPLPSPLRDIDPSWGSQVRWRSVSAWPPACGGSRCDRSTGAGACGVGRLPPRRQAPRHRLAASPRAWPGFRAVSSRWGASTRGRSRTAALIRWPTPGRCTVCTSMPSGWTRPR